MANVKENTKTQGLKKRQVSIKQKCETVQKYLNNTFVQEFGGLIDNSNSLPLNEDLLEEVTISIPYWMDEVKYIGTPEWRTQEVKGLKYVLEVFRSVLTSTNFEEEELFMQLND